jgi:hypothetical protein
MAINAQSKGGKMKGAELLGFFQMCLKMGMDEMLVQEMYKRTDRINERGGPQPKDYETVSAFVFEMDRLKLQPFFERLFIDPYREWVKDVEGSTPHSMRPTRKNCSIRMGLHGQAMSLAHGISSLWHDLK